MERKTDTQTIKVVYGIDRNYLVPAAVSIHSLCGRATAPPEIVVYGEGLEPSDHETLLRVGEASGADIDVRKYDAPSPRRQGLRSRWPAIVTLPLELPWLVEGRCLFVDADTLVVGDVGEIMAIDLEGMPLGACMDPYFDGSSDLATTSRRLVRTRFQDVLLPKRSGRKRESELRRAVSMGLRPGDLYFNSGVLVMECDAIRALAPLSSRGLPLNDPGGMEPYANHLPDQDRLNEFFAGRYRRLPMRWNLAPMARGGKGRHWPESVRQEHDAAAAQPGIWHFAGPERKKPWSRSLKSRLAHRRHPAFRAWRETYGKIRDLCGN